MATPSSAGARRAAPLPRRLLPLLFLLLLQPPAAAGAHSALLLRAPPPAAAAAEPPRSRRAAPRPPEPIQVYGQVSSTGGGGEPHPAPLAPQITAGRRVASPRSALPPRPGQFAVSARARGRGASAAHGRRSAGSAGCWCREWAGGEPTSATARRAAAPRGSAAGGWVARLQLGK